jgi:hypothetical protein
MVQSNLGKQQRPWPALHSQSGTLTRLLVRKRHRNQPESPFWNPEWRTVCPTASSLGLPLQTSVKTFSGRVCSKALTLAGTQIRDPQDVGATASNRKIVGTRLVVRRVQFGTAEPFFPSLRWIGRGDKRSQRMPLHNRMLLGRKQKYDPDT